MSDASHTNPHESEAQARLAAIIESSDDAIISKTLNGVVTSWNAGAERIFGWTSDEAVGKPITILIPNERLEEEPKILARLRAGERVDHFETIRLTKDGRRINVSVTISPVRDATGRIVGVSKVARDITLQKRFHEEIEAARNLAVEARATAEQANRAKDNFLSVLSHELRTPLTPVLMAIGIIERDAANMPPELAQHVAMIRRNIETEARLVDDLLDLTRIAQGKIQLRQEVVDVHAALRNVISMFEREIQQKALTIALSLRASDSHVWADAGRFQQIVLNLLSNAVKFTPAEGTITLRTGNDDGRLKLEVTDTGVGIEPDVLPRLFQPFEQGERTVTRQFGGLGLGLSIIKSLIEMHGGSVTARSAGHGQGATFTIELATVALATASSRATPTEPGALRKSYRVLLVEDHPDTRQMMGIVLRNFGCAVTQAGSVKEAVEAADHGTFDVLVSDIGLPDGSGLDVMRHLASRTNVPGIALSGFGQDEDLRRSRDAGFSTHLTKPVNIDLLQEAIQRVTA